MYVPTLTNNLHEKYVKTDWLQLWADDHFAAVFSPDGSDYWVTTDNHREIVRVLCTSFSDGLDYWNKVINEHLARHIVPGAVTRKIQYDYKNQAYAIDGLYVRCNHPAEMDCSCYGKLHADEKAAI